MMLNSEIDSLQEVIAILKNYNNYTTYIEVSPDLYTYLRLQCKTIAPTFNKDVYPETLFGCRIFLNPELEKFEYRITRKENGYE